MLPNIATLALCPVLNLEHLFPFPFPFRDKLANNAALSMYLCTKYTYLIPTK